MKNKKKTFIPFCVSTILYGVGALAAIALLVYILVSENRDALRLIIGSLLLLILLYSFVSPIIMYRMKFDGEALSMNKDFGIFKEDRVQYKEKVELKNIKEYKVILSDRNSKGEAYKTKAPKKKYIEFIMNDGSKKRLYVSLYFKKQILKVLSLVKDITGIDVTTQEENK